MMMLRQVDGSSMLPVLRPGRVVVARRCRQPRVGDIVIIRHDGLEKIKRVTRVRESGVFVEGDNPVSSTDSRHFGWIDISLIQGRVIWPRTQNHSFLK